MLQASRRAAGFVADAAAPVWRAQAARPALSRDAACAARLATTAAGDEGQPPPAERRDLSPLLQPRSARRVAIDAMLRVDHAGECAAVRIYDGQRAVLGHTAEGPLLAEMAEHERLHLERFQRMVRACVVAAVRCAPRVC